jgi:hypothetical protein
MQYYCALNPRHRIPPLVPDNTPTLICSSCGDAMKHLRTIPKIWSAVEAVYLRLPFLRRCMGNFDDATILKSFDEVPKNLDEL